MEKDPITWAIAICIVFLGFKNCVAPGLATMEEAKQCTPVQCEMDGEETGAIP